MTALPFLTRSRRVLVVVPSDLIRRQVSREFQTLASLRDLGAIPAATPPPRIRALTFRVGSEAAWADFEDYDVVVTTPNCISEKYPGTARPPDDFFDLLIIDEAHHEAAETWRWIVQDARCPCVLLTATPFRSDRRALSGDIVFWYRLRDAIRDGVYAPIEFVPVTKIDDEEFEITLARRAINLLNTPRHRAFGSQLLVRTDRVDDALHLSAIYASLGLTIPALHSRLKPAEVRRIVASLEDGTSRGVIAVGILTEGFNLPRLKIAAYHAKHKSFAATLQFVGRLARTAEDLPLQAELLAAADDVSDETKQLYADDASWSELLVGIADAAVEKERELRTYVSTFIGLPEDFSLVNVTPKRRAEVFALPEGAVVNLSRPLSRLVRSPVLRFFHDQDLRLVAYVSLDRVHPSWLNSTNLDTEEFNLSVVCVDQAAEFIYVLSHSDAAVQQILFHVTGVVCERVRPIDLNNALHTYAIEKYSSVGLRSSPRSAPQGVSYRTFAGTSAGDGVRPSDMSTASAGHLIARYRDGSDTRSVGISYDGGSIWDTSTASLLDYREWCNEISRRLSRVSAESTPPLLRVAVRRPFDVYPASVIGCDVSDMYNADVMLVVGETQIRLISAELRMRSAGNHIVLGVTYENRLLGRYRFDTRGRLEIIADIDASRDGEPLLFSSLLNQYGIQFVFADGSTVYGSGIVRPAQMPTVRGDLCEVWDWQDVDIRHEALPARPPFRMNVQQKTAEQAAAQGWPFVIVDDGAGELADIVAIRSTGPQSIEVCLFHCKWSSDDRPGLRVRDIYEVVCQVNRGLRWTEPRAFLREMQRRLRARDRTRVVFGESADLEALFEEFEHAPPAITFSMAAVQPGISVSGIQGWKNGSDLLASCDQWCMELQARLTVIGSV